MKRTLALLLTLALVISCVFAVQAFTPPESYVHHYARTSETLSPVIEGETYHFPVKQGDFFFYFNRMQEDAAYRDAHFDWLRMFRVLKTNGYYTMPRYSAKETKKSDGRTFFYISLNGFYDYEAYSAQFGTPPEGVIYGVTVGDYGNYILQTDVSGEYLPASYPDGVWRYEALESHPEWFINPQTPVGGLYSGDCGGYYGGPAYFFNFDEEELEAFTDYMASVILKYARKTGYTGLFFDYCSAGLDGSFVPGRILDLFQSKYGLSSRAQAVEKYNELAGAFLSLLRSKLPEEFEIFANQSLYAHEDYYENVDYDLVESYFTSYTYGRLPRTIQVKGKDGNVSAISTSQTFFRPWTSDKADSDYDWVKNGSGISDFLSVPAPALAAIKADPENSPSFYFLDYMIPKYVVCGEDEAGNPIYEAQTDRNAIYYSYAGSKLLGCSGSNSDWYGGEGEYDQDDLYFVDLGAPVGDDYALKKWDGTAATGDEQADYVIRYYENGFVLLTTGKITEPTKITVPKDGTSGKRGIYDLYETNFIKNASGDHAITLQPELYEMYAGYVNPADENDIDDGYRPLGRVFLYVD